jgi:hypothetical protein
MDKVIAYATVASVCADFILLLVTAWYAWHTKRMVDEMKEGRIKSQMPIITCDIQLDYKKTLDVYGRFNNITIQNIGNSPAIVTTIELRLLNPDTSTLKIESQSWFIGTVSLSNQPIIAMNPCDLNVLHSSDQPSIEITASYSNTYGIVMKTISVFDLKIAGPEVSLNVQERFNWTKQKETVLDQIKN